MPVVLFRTQVGAASGIGHLVRCVALARELMQRGYRPLFVLDSLAPGVTPFLSGLEYRELYKGHCEHSLDFAADARALLRLSDEMDAEWVVVDDYRLDELWECLVRASGLKLCVFDDLLRPHDSDVLVDCKWRGTDTTHAYDQLVPMMTKRLLGPEYVPLGQRYADIEHSAQQDKAFTVLVSVGGGNYLDLLEQVVAALLSKAEDFCRPLRILPVLGPFVTGGDSFLERYSQERRVEPVVGEADLFPYLNQANLYIGATGGILYQLLALGIPALTFPIADNQHNDLRCMEDLGHYFHLERWDDQAGVELPAFTTAMMLHQQRIKRLMSSARVKVDGLGVQRIADAIDGRPDSSKRPEVTEKPDIKTMSLAEGYTIRAVTDSDINHYLESRNLPGNRRNMIGADEISRLHHYAWWFNAKRESFLLLNQGSASLYIWHELKHVAGQAFLIGGWFVCEGEKGFQSAMLALDWQLKYCDERYPGVPWVALIHRENRFVRLLNEQAGFSDIDSEHPYGTVIAQLFKGSGAGEFHQMVREPAQKTGQAGIK